MSVSLVTGEEVNELGWDPDRRKFAKFEFRTPVLLHAFAKVAKTCH
jgi:hypothetical protein